MASLRKKLAFVSNKSKGIFSGKYRSREEQIARAVSYGNLKRAEKLSKHHLGEPARIDSKKEDSYADSTLFLDKEDNPYKLSYAGTRGDRFQEQALALYGIEETSFDSALRSKCAKIYSMVRKGKFGDPKNVLRNIDSKYGLDISSDNPEGYSRLYRGMWENNINYFRTLADPKRKSQTGDAGVAMTILYSAFKRRDKLRKQQERSLESTLSPASLAIASLIGSVFFLSSNVTGNAIAGYNISTANISGIILLILALIFGGLYLKNRKKKEVSIVVSNKKKKIPKKKR